MPFSFSRKTNSHYNGVYKDLHIVLEVLIMSKFSEYMRRSYTKGDYYGSLAVVLGLYAALGVSYAIYNEGLGIKKAERLITNDDVSKDEKRGVR